MYDYVVVGAGPFGCTFARLAAEAGRHVLLVDRRDGVGGNCATRLVEGIHVHEYGPHQFHTSSREVWDWVNRFAEFNSYQAHVAARVEAGDLYSFPLNLWTFRELWGTQTWFDAKERIEATKEYGQPQDTVEGWCLANIGRELYELFIEGYTRKQWRRDPAELPASLVRRLPVRSTFDARYFSDRYQGIPLSGYTRLFENMIDGPRIDTLLAHDFFEDRRLFEKLARTVVYSGKVDALLDYRFGDLEYRTLRFEHQTLEGDHQGIAIVNDTSASRLWTRTVEHKHFVGGSHSKTVVTREYPEAFTRDAEPYYPVFDDENQRRYARYREAALGLPKYVLGGRLGTYQYLDMHQVIAQAFATWRRETAVAA